MDAIRFGWNGELLMRADAMALFAVISKRRIYPSALLIKEILLMLVVKLLAAMFGQNVRLIGVSERNGDC